MSRQQWLVSMFVVCVCERITYTVSALFKPNDHVHCTYQLVLLPVLCIYCYSNSYNCGCCWMVLRRYNSQKSWADQQCPQPIQWPLPVWGAQPHQDQHGDSAPEGQHTPAALRWVHSFTLKQKELRSFVSTRASLNDRSWDSEYAAGLCGRWVKGRSLSLCGRAYVLDKLFL